MYAGGFLSLATDEFAKVELAWRGLNEPAIWFDYVWLPGHFPLVAAAYVLIGDIFIASRLVSVLFGIVAIFGVYRLGYHLKADGVGGLAAILMATSPLTVWLSSTGLVDILYVALFILGLSYYVQWQRSGGLSALYVAGTLLAVSCTFHHNAWLAGMAVGVLVAIDLIWDRSRNRLHGLIGLCILSIVPIAWCAWNWLSYGDPLFFLHTHVEHSASIYEKIGGSSPSLKNAIYRLAWSILHLGPVLAALAFASAAGVVSAPEERQTLWRLWFVLLIFGGGLILLFARGGMPTAFPERYLLLPLLIMTVLSAYILSVLFRNADRVVRVFAGLLCSIALMTNLWFTLHSPNVHERIQEAVEVADFLAQTDHVQAGSRVLLEVKAWNHHVIGVFLNDPSMIIEAPNQPPVLLQSEEAVRRFAQEREIGCIAVWSEASRTAASGVSRV
jgi:4-amino-4-deoxy-L-arabinose transferase-like glycosyltransferase